MSHTHTRMTLFVAACLACILASVSFAARKDVTITSRVDNVIIDNERGTSEVVAGEFKLAVPTDYAVAAVDLISSRPDLFNLRDAKNELKVLRQETDRLGDTHVRLDQVYQGLKVWGCQKVVHFRDASTIYMVAGQTIPTPSISTTPKIPSSAAEATAVSAVKSAIGIEPVKTHPELVIYPDGNTSRLVWQVVVAGEHSPLIKWQVFVDAVTGAVIHQYNDVKEDGPTVSTGIGVGHKACTLQTYQIGLDYEMIDATRPMYVPPIGNLQGVIVTYDMRNGQIYLDPDRDNVFDDDSAMQAAVSAQTFGSATYKYFSDAFGRNSYDNAGGGLTMNVHYGTNVNNAYGGGGTITYGDGDGVNYLPFSGDLDVVAHEFTHSVTDFTANLIYEFQSGALNESYSDFFGKMVDSNNWLLGDDIRLTTPGFLRSMQDPHQGPNPSRYPFGYQPAKMSEWVTLPASNDGGGVHTNSGVPNKAGYLVANVIGRPKAGQIWYRTLSVYLTPSSDMNYWSSMTLQSAKDLFGDLSPEVMAVANALDSIGFSLVLATPTAIVPMNARLGAVSDTTLKISSYRTETVTIQTITSARGKLSIAGTVPQALPTGATATFTVSFDATSGYSLCDIGAIRDTIIVTTSSVAQPTIRVPVEIDLGYILAPYATRSFSNACLTANVSNLPGFDGFTRNGFDALAKATLLVGLADTLVYQDFYAVPNYAIVDSIVTTTMGNGDITKAVRISSSDGAVKGTITYQYEPTNVPGCGYMVADYKLYNTCPTPITILSGLLADFDLPASAQTNYADFDSGRKLVYVRDNGNTVACALAFLKGTPRNLRSINNPAIIWDGFTPIEAYYEMDATTNSSGNSPDDWSALLTFGKKTLAVGDTVDYRTALLYSTSGTSGFDAILTQINPVSCCVGTTGNVNMTGIVDLADLSALVSYLTGGGYVLSCQPEANVNSAGIVDLADLSALVSYLTGGGYVLPNCM